CFEASCPLPPRPDALPARAMRNNIGFGRLPERHRRSGLELDRGLLCALVLEGVDAADLQLACSQCGVAGFLEGDITAAAEAHVARLPAEAVAVAPRLSVLGNLQIQSAAVTMPAGASRFDEACGQYHDGVPLLIGIHSRIHILAAAWGDGVRK